MNFFSVLITEIRELWRFRRFVAGSVAREFQSRYARSILGASWLILAPFAMMLVYTVVFAEVMRARLPGVQSNYAYSLFLCSGLLPWQWMAELISRCTGIFVDHGGMLKKTSFPRSSLPVIAIFSSALNFFLVFFLFVLLLFFLGQWPGWMMTLLLPLFALQVLFALSLGMALGVLNVFFRDVGQALSILLQFWFWLTPIVYPVSALPDWATKLLSWNPVFPLFDAYQKIIVWGQAPDWSGLANLLLLTIFFALIAVCLYRASKDQLVDEL